MKHASPGEYLALVIAMLVLIIVLVSSYMCLQLYGLRKPAPPCAGGSASAAEGFSGPYAPACGPAGTGRRRHECRGVTSGLMPAIEVGPPGGNGPCCGALGVPP
jgi:hypothetical protein